MIGVKLTCYFKSLIFQMAHFYYLFTLLALLCGAAAPCSALPETSGNTDFRVKNIGLKLPIPDNLTIKNGNSPEVIAIISPKNGDFPEINLIRTRIYPSNTPADRWAPVVLADYHKIGLSDALLIGSHSVHINRGTLEIPVAELTYSRAGAQWQTLVGWIKHSLFDIVITAKSPQPEFESLREEMNRVLESIEVEPSQLREQYTNTRTESYWKRVLMIASLIAAAFTTWIFRNKKRNQIS